MEFSEIAATAPSGGTKSSNNGFHADSSIAAPTPIKPSSESSSQGVNWSRHVINVRVPADTIIHT